MGDRGDLDARVRQAALQAQQGRLGEAAGGLERVLEEAPQHLGALDTLGFVRFFQGRPRDAETCCRRALAIDALHAYAHKGLGLCLAKQGHVEDGVTSLQRAIELKPGWLDPWWDLCVVFADAGRLDEALALVLRAQAELPAHGAELAKMEASLRAKLDATRRQDG